MSCKLLTIQEVCTRTGLNPWGLRTAIRRGHLKVVPAPVGERANGVRVTEGALRAFLDRPHRKRAQSFHGTVKRLRGV